MPCLGGQLWRVVLVVSCALAPATAPPAARAAMFVTVDGDSSAEGLNDPTPRTPIGGNPGTTLGAQRRLAIAHAAEVWGALIDSAVEIRLAVSFAPLYCDGQSATLGSAGPTAVLRDFAGAPSSNTWYPQALANRLAGVDLLPDYDDIEMEFSSSIDSGCLPGLAWYYGLDGQAAADQLDFATTVLHEIAHGLGFLTLVDTATGRKFQGLDDAFMQALRDSRTGLLWPSLTDAGRRASSVDTGQLVWAGPEVAAAAALLLAGRHQDGGVELYAPDPLESGSSVSHFSTSLDPDELMEPFITAQPSMDLAVLALVDIGWTLPSLSGSPTPTQLQTPTPSPNATGVPPTPAQACDGDCDGDGVVRIDDLLRAVSIALGTISVAACSSADVDGNQVLSVAELLTAVARATDGCPAAGD